jgi:hypothetical protein
MNVVTDMNVVNIENAESKPERQFVHAIPNVKDDGSVYIMFSSKPEFHYFGYCDKKLEQYTSYGQEVVVGEQGCVCFAEDDGTAMSPTTIIMSKPEQQLVENN